MLNYHLYTLFGETAAHVLSALFLKQITGSASETLSLRLITEFMGSLGRFLTWIFEET